jgi:(+)-trans-carveol dehydrogenase
MADTKGAPLAGKVAFITGAARGQGRSHAVRLARDGADVIAVDICAPIDSVPYPLATKADLDETASEVECLGRRVFAAQADVRDIGALTAAADAGVAQFGRLDVVVCNAGIFSAGPLLDLLEGTWRDMIDVNLTGAFHTVKAAVPHIVAGGRGGSVIITSSSIALRAALGTGHYAAAKDGLLGLMRTLALELAPAGIRVNSIHPSTVDTPMIQNEANYRLFRPDLDNPTRADAEPVYRSMTAMQVPWVEASDITNAIAFLASDQARYITGAALPVDAGYALL